MNSTYSAAASLAGSLHGSTEASAQGATSNASATGFSKDRANLFDFVVSSSSFMSVALKTTRADSLFFVLKSTKTTPPSFTSGKAVGETNNSSLLNELSWTKTLTVLVCGSSAGFCSGLVSIFFSCAASLMYKNARSLALRRMRWWALLLFRCTRSARCYTIWWQWRWSNASACRWKLLLCSSYCDAVFVTTATTDLSDTRPQAPPRSQSPVWGPR